jgi:hypothetical protein
MDTGFRGRRWACVDSNRQWAMYLKVELEIFRVLVGFVYYSLQNKRVAEDVVMFESRKYGSML